MTETHRTDMAKLYTMTSTADPPPPRLHVIPARSAPIAAVLRRGPSEWWHVLRWNLESLTVEPGAWLHGRIYPRRCDVSPDGRLLAYFAMSGPPPWDGFYGVAKLPWLKALAAWWVGNTWATGCEFHADGALALGFPPGTPPDHGTFPPGLTSLTPPQLSGRALFIERDVSLELRRGWELLTRPETDGAGLELRRARPGGDGSELRITHAGHTFTEPAIEGAVLRYALDGAPLDDAAWADWDAGGRLLVATTAGALEVREPAGDQWRTTWSHDLGELEPDPAEAPAWACRW
jgi:hypothetical protein